LQKENHLVLLSIFLSDETIAKNYLSKDELSLLNRSVNVCIDYAEFQAAREKVMAMKDWIKKLDVFLKYNEQEILSGLGNVSHKADFDKLGEASKLLKFDSEDHE
jgi:hypothetical protein